MEIWKFGNLNTGDNAGDGLRPSGCGEEGLPLAGDGAAEPIGVTGSPVVTAEVTHCFSPPSAKRIETLELNQESLLMTQTNVLSQKKSSDVRGLVEAGGVEPPSESVSAGTSPCADGYCGLSASSPSGRQAVTPAGQVAS